ncbi:unnamed protein product [Caenorhabditis bovis]|uniref:Uncharacterized protein n=1 Tax=Caenorhabditis bovis TaxID=2654633 RepID=A0A8S1ETH0_9PELO|nr:unnamed protein product [Caenorhabditis bovis]
MRGRSFLAILFILLAYLGFDTIDAKFLNGDCFENKLCGEHGFCEYRNPKNGDEFWCRCEEGYGGDHCEKKCDLSCEPHHKCIFDIAQRPTCVCKDCDKYGNRTAHCPTGFGGADCSIQGWCYPDECLHGGKCVGSGDSAHCVCRREYTGQRCELDFDECSVPDFCNNGKCFNLYGSYQCECEKGFTNPKCAVLEDAESESQYVTENNPCVVAFFPELPDGYGYECENQGVCVTYAPNKTRCECAPGFEGEICEKDIDECAYNPCENGATCVNSHGDFECFCRSGYDGKFCENNIDDCVGHKCAPGSKCVDGPSTYTCECEHGKMGAYCDKVNPCIADPSLCHDRGICTGMPETGDFVCTCDRGFEGERCEIDLDECKMYGEVCYHGGKCVDMPGNFKCECPRGFNGTQCEQIVHVCEDEEFECQNGGTCFAGPFREPLCQCEQGYIGKHCETKCPEGYGGLRCNIHLEDKVCGPNLAKCLNGGVCAGGFCICHANYTGDRCELSRIQLHRETDICATEPCLNNATCVNLDHSIGYVCMCKDGYEGNICEKKIDVCTTKPCYNGGKCQKTSLTARGYTCKCPPGYVGANCETIARIDCASRNCNKGVCVDDGVSTKCECPYGYAGVNCEQKLNVEHYNSMDRLLREMCANRNCSSRANDGNCDEDCNFAACDFDGGDCSGKQKPFAKCRYGNMCAALFANGICDAVCNNEDCLYDGMDCMPVVPRCPVAIRESCAERFANGKCDLECNTEGCGYDGGDCDSKTATKLLSDIRVKIRMSPSEFQKNGGEFLMKASAALRSVIRIQRDKEGPLVFEWDEELGDVEGGRIQMNVETLKNQNVLSKVIKRRSRRSAKKGVMVWLEVEVSDESAGEQCKTTSERASCLFSNSQSVVDYLSAQITKKVDVLGVPIYEAMVAKPSRSGGTTNIVNSLIMTIIGFVVFAVIIAGVITIRDENRSRKRRIISAPVWMPPTEQESEKIRKNPLSLSQNSLLGSAHLDPKRRRVDSMGYSVINGQAFNSNTTPYRQNTYVPNFDAEYGGYGNSDNSIVQTEVNPNPPLLLLEAAGSGAIQTVLTPENVNEPDAKYRRCCLHWLAANNSGKAEELIVDESEQCIRMGADVNARDCDENTPLMLAVRSKRTRLALVLMHAGADPTIFNSSERSALHEAAVNLDYRMMQLLLTDRRLVLEIDELDRNGKSALMEVAGSDHDTQIAKFLISCGAKIENDGASRKDSEVYRGRTALHYAALHGNIKMVEFLVSQNANKDKQDEAGQTPLMLAAKEGHAHVVQFLVSQNASLDTTDQLDKTARQLAEAQHHYPVVEIIDHATIEKEMADASRYHLQMSGKPVKGRPTIKAVKRSASRKGYQTSSSSSRDSTLHMTPPPSDGSISTPSPQNFLTRTTPTALQYPTSPTSQFANTSGGYNNPQSNGSTASNMIKTDSSPEYHPQDMDMPAGMWYGNSPPYQKMPGFSSLYDQSYTQQMQSNMPYF